MPLVKWPAARAIVSANSAPRRRLLPVKIAEVRWHCEYSFFYQTAIDKKN